MVKVKMINLMKAIFKPNQKDSRASLVAQSVKNPPVMQETWVWFLGWKIPLEKGMATHFRILAWRIPWREELQSMGSQKDSNWFWLKKKKNQFKFCILHIFCTKFLIINMDVLISRKRKKVFPFREKNK